MALLRLSDIIGDPRTGKPPRIPVSRSVWYARVADGTFPRPLRLRNPAITVWRSEDIDALEERLEREATA